MVNKSGGIRKEVMKNKNSLKTYLEKAGVGQSTAAAHIVSRESNREKNKVRKFKKVKTKEVKKKVFLNPFLV